MLNTEDKKQEIVAGDNRVVVLSEGLELRIEEETDGSLTLATVSRRGIGEGVIIKLQSGNIFNLNAIGNTESK